MFSVVNLSRHLNCNAENILINANKKFENRFRTVESKLKKMGKNIYQTDLKEMDAIWNRVKKEEK